jgi:hypothetical protein
MAWHTCNGYATGTSRYIFALDATANPTVKALAGRYATILPEVISGDVQGYYVGIAGSGQYFKVDYTNPAISTAGTRRHPEAEQPFYCKWS